MTDDIDRSFNWYNGTLIGIRGPIDADNPRAGFYRVRNGRNGPLVPVAFWYEEETGNLRCHKNGKSVDDLSARELWVYASKNPVSPESYWQFIDGHGWSDNDAGAAATAEIDPSDPVAAIKADVAAARENLPAYKLIESDEQAAKAQTLRSALTALSGKADKARVAEKEPHLQASRDVDAKWQPVVKEAKQGADDIRAALGAWEDEKRIAARKAQAEADNIARLHAEATAKAADENKPAPPPPPIPVASNMPAPSAQIKGGSGRTASVTVANVVTDIDLDKCFAKFRTAPELRELFMVLADKSMKAGICTADDVGAIITEKSVIR